MCHKPQQPFTPTNNHSPELRRVLAIAAIEAERESHGQQVSVQHFLAACIMDSANVGASMFEQQGLTLADVRALDFTKKKEPLQ